MARSTEDDYAPDHELGAFMRERKVKSPIETVVALHHVESVLRFGAAGRRKIVELGCGHVVVANRGQTTRMRCPRCQTMIEEGRDFVSFRYLDRGLPAP